MKKILLPVFLLFCSAFSLFGQTPCLPVSEMISISNETPAVWEPGTLSKFTYDAAGHLLVDSIFGYDLGTSSWLPSQIRVKTWNAAGWEESNTQINYESGSGAWVPQMRGEYEYDSKGNQTLHKDLRWNVGTSAWDTFSVVRTVRTFDASDSLLTYVIEERLPPSLVYVPFASMTITRDASGRKIEELHAQESPHTPQNRFFWEYPASGGYTRYEHHRMLDGGWKLYFRHTDIVWHDFALNQRESYHQKYWDVSGATDTNRYEITWLPFNSFTILNIDLSGSAPDTVGRGSTYFNALGLESAHYYESFVSSWDTTDLDSTSYLHNPAGCMLQSILHATRWFGPGTFGPFVKHDYKYAAVGVDEVRQEVTFTLSPNPTWDLLTPHWQGGEREIEVMDLAGRRLMHYPRWESGAPLSVASLAQGIYLLRCNDEALRFEKLD